MNKLAYYQAYMNKLSEIDPEQQEFTRKGKNYSDVGAIAGGVGGSVAGLKMAGKIKHPLLAALAQIVLTGGSAYGGYKAGGALENTRKMNYVKGLSNESPFKGRYMSGEYDKERTDLLDKYKMLWTTYRKENVGPLKHKAINFNNKAKRKDPEGYQILTGDKNPPKV